MKLKDLKNLLVGVTDDAEIKVENGDIVIAEPEPVVYKFKVGDKVKADDDQTYIVTRQFVINREPFYNIKDSRGEIASAEKWLQLIPQDSVEEKAFNFKFEVGDEVIFHSKTCEVVNRVIFNKTRIYNIKNGEKIYCALEDEIALNADITERIKSLEDACDWCRNNGCNQVVRELSLITSLFRKDRINSPSLMAFLKLRVITCSLNEGWEPKIDSDIYRYRVLWDSQSSKFRTGSWSISEQLPKSVLFRTKALAEYAATQFAGIYADFCGCKKSDNQ